MAALPQLTRLRSLRVDGLTALPSEEQVRLSMAWGHVQNLKALATSVDRQQCLVPPVGRRTWVLRCRP